MKQAEAVAAPVTIVLPDGEVYGASDEREADIDTQAFIKESTHHIVNNCNSALNPAM